MGHTMKMAVKENFRFTDKRLAAGLLLSLPWLLADWSGIIDPHHDATGVPSLACGVVGLVCVVWSLVRKTAQSVFLLLTMIVSMIATVTPFICVAHDRAPAGDGGAWFGYRYVGRTDDGADVLETSNCGGGSGVFVNLMLVRIERDKGMSCNWTQGVIRADRERLVIKKLGEIGLGDRWSGELKVQGNKVFIGKDRVLSIEPS